MKEKLTINKVVKDVLEEASGLLSRMENTSDDQLRSSYYGSLEQLEKKYYSKTNLDQISETNLGQIFDEAVEFAKKIREEVPGEANVTNTLKTLDENIKKILNTALLDILELERAGNLDERYNETHSSLETRFKKATPSQKVAILNEANELISVIHANTNIGTVAKFEETSYEEKPGESPQNLQNITAPSISLAELPEKQQGPVTSLTEDKTPTASNKTLQNPQSIPQKTQQTREPTAYPTPQVEAIIRGEPKTLIAIYENTRRSLRDKITGDRIDELVEKSFRELEGFSKNIEGKFPRRSKHLDDLLANLRTKFQAAAQSTEEKIDVFKNIISTADNFSLQPDSLEKQNLKAIVTRLKEEQVEPRLKEEQIELNLAQTLKEQLKDTDAGQYENYKGIIQQWPDTHTNKIIKKVLLETTLPELLKEKSIFHNGKLNEGLIKDLYQDTLKNNPLPKTAEEALKRAYSDNFKNFYTLEEDKNYRQAIRDIGFQKGNPGSNQELFEIKKTAFAALDELKQEKKFEAAEAPFKKKIYDQIKILEAKQFQLEATVKGLSGTDQQLAQDRHKAMETLVTYLTQRADHYFMLPTASRMENRVIFQEDCSSAIKDAAKTLQQHQTSWKEMLRATFSDSDKDAASLSFSIFSTKSAQLLEETNKTFQEDPQKSSIPSPQSGSRH